MKKFIFLVNPVSGTVKKQRVIEQIKREAGERQVEFEICDTRADCDYSEIAGKITRDGVTHVAIVGGDGTVNQVVGYLRGLPVAFGIIPMGSGNGLAFTAGIPRLPGAALQLIFEGTARKVDAFLVNGKFACMLSGLGFDAQVAHEFANKASRGLLTYTRQTLINFFSCGTYPFHITIDHLQFTTEAFFISIANSNQFGNRVTIAPQASLSDGLLDVVIVQKMNKAMLPFAIISQLRGANKTQLPAEDALKKNIIYFQAAGLQIGNPGRAPLHIDGEPRDSSELFDIRVIPGCFDLIQP